MSKSTIILCTPNKVEEPVLRTKCEWLNQLLGVKKPKKEEKKMVIDITISVPAKKTRKHKVRVFSNFVKVGWDQYSIKRDWLCNEYVIIKGNRYEVVRDIFGQGYLVEL